MNIEVNGYPPNVDVPSLSQDGVDVNNPVNAPDDLNPFIGNANLLNVPVFKSVNYVPGSVGWALFKDGTSDGIGGFASRCRVYRNADVTITAGSARKILFDTVEYDNLNEFDETTNNRFTATVAGRYLVTSLCQFDPSAADVDYYLEIKKSGTIVSNKYAFSYTAGVFSIQVTDIVSLTAGQYIEIFIDSSEGANYTCKGGTSKTYLDIHRLS